MHERFVAALGALAFVRSSSGTTSRPLELHGRAPLPAAMRLYLYRMTTHSAERQPGAYRIQVTLPGLRRRSERGHFDHHDDAFVLLAGYAPELDVFALWDAGLIDTPAGIPFSRGCQVRDTTLYAAMNDGIAEQVRTLRSREHGTEIVVAARASRLVDGVQRRWQRTVERMAGVAS
jgi:hypothetical protein